MYDAADFSIEEALTEPRSNTRRSHVRPVVTQEDLLKQIKVLTTSNAALAKQRATNAGLKIVQDKLDAQINAYKQFNRQLETDSHGLGEKYRKIHFLE